MLYPHVSEVVRAGAPLAQAFPRSQRELVELSLRTTPSKTVRPVVERDRLPGIFR